jgi:hypothetical protein
MVHWPPTSPVARFTTNGILDNWLDVARMVVTHISGIDAG